MGKIRKGIKRSREVIAYIWKRTMEHVADRIKAVKRHSRSEEDLPPRP